jgi:hypothetical protein
VGNTAVKERYECSDLYGSNVDNRSISGINCTSTECFTVTAKIGQNANPERLKDNFSATGVLCSGAGLLG